MLDLRVVSQEHIPGIKRDLLVCVIVVVEYHSAGIYY